MFSTEYQLEWEKPTQKFYGLFWESSICIWKINHETANHPATCFISTLFRKFNHVSTNVSMIHQRCTWNCRSWGELDWNSCRRRVGDLCFAKFLQQWVVYAPESLWYLADIHAINLPQKIYPFFDLWILRVRVWVIMTVWWMTPQKWCIFRDYGTHPAVMKPSGNLHITTQSTFEDDFPFLQVGYVSSLQGHFLMYLYQCCRAILTVVSPKVVSAGHLVKLRERWQCAYSNLRLWPTFKKIILKQVVNIPPVDGKESGKPCKHQLRLVLDSFDFFVLANITIVCPHVVWMLYGGGVEWR